MAGRGFINRNGEWSRTKPPHRPFSEWATIRPVHDSRLEPGLLEAANPFGKLKLHAF
jgi:hypothetical protein